MSESKGPRSENPNWRRRLAATTFLSLTIGGAMGGGILAHNAAVRGERHKNAYAAEQARRYTTCLNLVQDTDNNPEQGPVVRTSMLSQEQLENCDINIKVIQESTKNDFPFTYSATSLNPELLSMDLTVRLPDENHLIAAINRERQEAGNINNINIWGGTATAAFLGFALGGITGGWLATTSSNKTTTISTSPVSQS